MVAKIELLNHDKVVRFWTYDGALARKLTNFDVPYGSFTKTDYDFDQPVFNLVFIIRFYSFLIFV